MDSGKKKKLIYGILIGLFIAASVILFFLIGKPLVNFVSDPQNMRDWVARNGLWSRVGFALITALQVIVAIIPGEPFEIAAGYAFGTLEGTLLCMAGIVLGSVVVFLFVRRFGVKAVEVFFPREKIEKLKFLQDEKKLTRLTFILFLIPGTPKDIMTYCVGLTRMKMSTWLLICTLARIPSIVTSTVCGDALGVNNFLRAAVVFGATAVVSLGGLWVYNHLNRQDRKKEK